MQVRKPLNLLNDIPREIRNDIYEYAFQTQYNCVTYRCTTKDTYHILSYDPQNDIFLSSSPIPALGLLSTCVQIYNEAVISLWKVNSFGLWPADLLFRLGSLGEDAFMHIQSLQVNLDLTNSFDLKWAEKLFSRIGGKWSIRDERTEGKTWRSLKRVQINPIRTEEMGMDVKWMQRISEAMHLRWKSEELLAGQNEDAGKTLGLYSKWMELFRKTGMPGNDAYLGNEVKRVVSVNTGWDEWAYWDQNEWVKKLSHGANMKAMEQVMKDLNETFGGELWANGILCYKEDKRLRKVFKMKPVDLLGC